ncbi:MAG: signal recognition particle receptor subunit alpha, partial [Pantoea sp.]|nr:signal recognition particle receptor subunit alpha [Pantoea sp.]
MAKEKKRGFFSWLGFGREETPAQPEEQKETLTEQPENTAENEASAAQQPNAEQIAEDIVATTQQVARQEQAEAAEIAAAVAPSEAIKPADATAPVEEEILPEAIKPADATAPVEEEILPEAIEPADATAPVEEEILPEAIEPADAIAPSEEEIASAAAIDDVIELEEVDAPATLLEAEQPGETPAITPEKDAAIATQVAVAVALSDTPDQDAALEEDAPLSDEELAALALADAEPEEDALPVVPVEQARPTKEGFFARLKRSLVKTRQNLGSGFISLFRGKKIDDELFEELEEQLLIADVGVDTTQRIISSLTQQANRKQLRDAEALYGLLKTEMA